MKTFPLRIQDDLHRALKTKCASEGRTMNEVITALIESYVKEKPKTKSK